ncbi:hypothetical protein AVL57_00300 (plasmid) [Alteromonas stellipolaris]|jgi:hypothetical protein|uniref:Uncharacterized protein n=1 Tax=Alteromonas stellipolaris TaxID=233316 RepID=A0ABN4LTN3_9ALTE|nr:hypothetical protein AVL57_00300 [Alteromonas stellipolaris]
MSGKLNDYSNLHFWRLGINPSMRLGKWEISAHIVYPLIPLWFSRETPLLIFSGLYFIFFLYAAYRGLSPLNTLRQIRSSLAGKRRFVSKVNRAKRFTNADY